MWKKIFLLGLLLLLLSPIYLISQLIDRQPLVTQETPPSAADARQAKALLKRSLRLLDQPRRATLVITQSDLSALAAFLNRGNSRLAAKFQLTDQGLEGRFSLRLPDTPLGDQLNLALQLQPAETGLAVGRVQLGNIPVSGPLALQMLQKISDLLLGEQLGSQLFQAVEKVDYAAGRLAVTFASGAELTQLKQKLQRRFEELRGSSPQVADLKQIRRYYRELSEAGLRYSEQRRVSLTPYLNAVFQLAEQRSEQGSAVVENQAALYALAIYLGSYQVQKFTGKMTDENHRFPKTRTGQVGLAGRRDLRQHFLVSAALKLLTDAELGFAVGEYKELLDSNRGGSGFSFIDLAADRAGLKFAEMATSSEEAARAFQKAMARVSDEASYFPDFSDLAEGLDERSFRKNYGDLDSQRYAEVVRLIDSRLQTLPLYRP